MPASTYAPGYGTPAQDAPRRQPGPWAVRAVTTRCAQPRCPWACSTETADGGLARYYAHVNAAHADRY